jgi:hypothetical protein
MKIIVAEGCDVGLQGKSRYQRNTMINMRVAGYAANAKKCYGS